MVSLRVGLASLIVVLLTSMLGCDNASNTAQPLTGTPVTAAGEYQRTLSYAGLTRTFLLHLPPAISTGKPLPLVLMLHGRGDKGRDFAQRTGMTSIADKEGFIVVAPDGTDEQDRTWNAGICCGYALEGKVDDVGFIKALLAELSKSYPLDRQRLYASGFSNGAMLAYRLALDLPDTFAAIAPVAGAMPVNLPTVQPVSLVTFHGTTDSSVYYGGGNFGDESTAYADVAHTVAYWAATDGCNITPARDENGSTSREDFTGCTAGREVTLYTIIGGEHHWPDALGLVGKQADETSTATIIWGFFKAHPKQ